MENQRKKGSLYEERAAHYLQEKGYRLLQANYRCRLGEIDLIARHGSYLVFIEVKYRKNAKSGLPVEAVDYRKQQKISRTAWHYMVRHGMGTNVPVRFDVVSILGEEIRLYENAFEFCGG